jgi:hypothetical protein
VGALVFDGAGATEVVAGADLEGVLPLEGEEVELVMTPTAGVALPLAPGEVVGTIEVSTSRGVAGTVDAVAVDPLSSPEESWLETALADVMGVFGGVLA